MNQTIRLHRDDPSRRDTAEPVRTAAPDSAEAVLARGHLWLRFPAALEAEFNADMLEPRRRLLVSCALIGCVGVLVGSSTVSEATPEIAKRVWEMVWIWLALVLGSVITTWFSPRPWRRVWHTEFTTATLATAMSLLITWMATASRADTAITHSAMVTVPVMYSCLAARLRFYWSLGAALVSLAAYVAFVKGFTPEQQQMVHSLTQLMVLSYAFALVANYAFEHRERRNWLLRKVEAGQRDALIDTSRQLQRLSTQDPLTGLDNRRQFDTNLQQALDKARSRGQALALLAIDVDYFKRYNDTYGHPAGDTCLAEVARVLATQAKAHGGSVARVGGEEFAMLLPDQTPELARQSGEAVCRAVAALRMPHARSAVADHVTLSVGLAHWDPNEPEPEPPLNLLDRADRALYRAKSTGRNRLCEALRNEATLREVTARPAATPAHTGAPEPDTTNPAADPATAAIEEACHRTLASQFHWLRFPTALETEYIEQHADQRRKHLTVTSLLGMVIFNLFAIGNRSMFPDIRELVLDGQVWVTLVVLLMTVLAYLIPRPLWREGFYSMNSAIVSVVSAWVLSHSQLTSTLAYASCLMLVPMFTGVGARQPFWFTCVPAVMTSLAAALMFKPVGPVQELVYADSLFMIINNMAYTLVLAYTLEHGSRKEWLLARIDGIQRDALMAASQRMKALSVVDPLTGICNRRQFEDDLERIWEECQEDQRPLGMLIIDVDHFKLYNDRQGHLAGDDCLKQVATLISQTAQADKGLAARLGGEEFGVLLPGGRINEALALAERIRATVSGATIAHDYAPSRHVTVSVGVASITPQQGVDRVSLFASADQALYEAKRAGRNLVMGPQQTNHHGRPAARIGTGSAGLA